MGERFVIGRAEALSGNQGLAAEFAVVGNGEAVGFVSNQLHETRGGGFERQDDWRFVTRQKDSFVFFAFCFG